jgi:DNA invertase Pin-like site-specific DNA recombinase
MTHLEHHPLPGELSTKITAHHLQRLACIYVRQSTNKQVAENRESQVNQYQLVQRAQELGWAAERIRIIDADLGLSGQSSAHRNGFQELVAEISLGHVGIVFGYEVSRLARNNSDWYHLLDLAAVFGTLIADHDGVYEPRLYNDRLLLGLKGTMSEAELHLLRLRLEGGRMSQVRRGEYRQHLPTGLVRLPDGQVIKDPDEQVRHTIELVFETFASLGSARQVLKYLVQHDILLPRRQTAGFHKGELLWKPPSDAALYDILRNPAYAGAFVYGRTQVDHARQKPGHHASGRQKKPMTEWIHIQHDVYPAYITWAQYLANGEQLRTNGVRYTELKAHGAQGAAREGSALLQGLATCGCCGHRMRIAYKKSQRYLCFALAKQFGREMCMSLHGPSIDEVVVQAFFRAIQPAQLDALEAVLSEQQAERERLVRQWEERLQRVHYEVHLAERQYQAVDPDNRLVAAELERRWEQKLRARQETEEAYERFQSGLSSAQLTEEMQEQFRHLSDTLPSLWQSGQLSNSQKKELLRTLISRVVLKRTAPDTVEVKIVWVSGHYSVEYARPPIHRECDVSNYDRMVERTRALWEAGLGDEQIAVQLASEGFHSARSTGVSPVAVQKIRLNRGWYHPLYRSRKALEFDGYLTATGLAQCLGVERTWVYRHIYRGEIDPQYIRRHPQSKVYLIRNDPQVIEQIRSLLPQKC